KSTVARVFVKSMGANARTLSGITGTLTSDQFPGAGTLLNLPIEITAPAGQPDRDNPNHSRNFLLPAQWTAAYHNANLVLKAEVKLTGNRAEANLDNNVYKYPDQSQQPLEFKQVTPLRIAYLTFCMLMSPDPKDPNACPRDAPQPTDAINDADALMQKIYPF